MAKKCGIYCIKNTLNHKKYIGLSRNIERRWCEHRHELRHQLHNNTYLQRAWDKYGENAFSFYIIEECSEKDLSNKEKYYINLFQSTSHEYGYNLTDGGENAVTTNRMVIDYRSNRVYQSVRNLMDEIHRSYPTISAWCRKRHNYMYYDEWLQLTTEEQEDVRKVDWKAIDHARLSEAHKAHNLSTKTRENMKRASCGKNNARANAIYCPELDEYFWGAKEACQKYGVNAGSISMCIRGKLAHAGKHPITGEGLTWAKVMKE